MNTCIGMIFLLLVTPIPWADPNQPDGRTIMKEQKRLQELKDEDRVIEMELVDRRGKSKIRKVHMWNLKGDDGLARFMLVFLHPRDVEGTGLLTWEQDQRDDDQWLYLPSLKKEKRISASGKKNKFMGTDFAYEDLSVEDLDENTYTLLDSVEVEGKDCWRIEARAMDGKPYKNSGYGKRILFMRKDIYFTVKTEYYSKKGKLTKVLENNQPIKIQGSVWRSDRFTMKDLKTRHQTNMKVLERKINQNLTSDQFTLRKLKSF